jgi:hypothetical protein
MTMVQTTEAPIKKRVEIGPIFADAMTKIIQDNKIPRILETGTYHGLGSTKIFAEALAGSGQLFTIDINHAYQMDARQNLKEFTNIVYFLGLSIPAKNIPTFEETEKWIAETKQLNPGIMVDYGGRADGYVCEVKPGQEYQDDWMGILLPLFQPQFILLDSAGHIGYAEFKHLMEVYNSWPFFLALDDVNHLKHWKTMEEIKTDARFTVLFENSERNGSAIVHFNPFK